MKRKLLCATSNVGLFLEAVDAEIAGRFEQVTGFHIAELVITEELCAGISGWGVRPWVFAACIVMLRCSSALWTNAPTCTRFALLHQATQSMCEAS